MHLCIEQIFLYLLLLLLLLCRTLKWTLRFPATKAAARLTSSRLRRQDFRTNLLKMESDFTFFRKCIRGRLVRYACVLGAEWVIFWKVTKWRQSLNSYKWKGPPLQSSPLSCRWIAWTSSSLGWLRIQWDPLSRKGSSVDVIINQNTQRLKRTLFNQD